MNQLTALRIRKYKGANILIINKWQNFIAIIFYKGQFYQTELDALKRGEYTTGEYAIACDTMLKEARKVVDVIKYKKSFINRIKNYATQIKLRIKLSGKEASGSIR